jgi:spore coat protein A, manganese oxidase
MTGQLTVHPADASQLGAPSDLVRRPRRRGGTWTAEVMQFRVDLPLAGAVPIGRLPSRLRETPDRVAEPAAVPRSLLVGERLDQYGRLQQLIGTMNRATWKTTIPPPRHPSGRRRGLGVLQHHFGRAPGAPSPGLLRNPRPGTLRRPTGPDHRSAAQHHRGPPPSPGRPRAAPKDTVLANPGEDTRIRARFDRPGRYVWHCHTLSHQDHEIMRPLIISGSAGTSWTCTLSGPQAQAR